MGRAWKWPATAPPSFACRALIDLANERGGDDNITLIVIHRAA